MLYVVLVTRHQTVWGDAYFYHESANLIADGKGFINPIDWIENHVRIQAADHPPLYLLYLAGWSIVGVTSTTGQLLVSTLLGAATIAVTAYAGKEIAGPGSASSRPASCASTRMCGHRTACSCRRRWRS